MKPIVYKHNGMWHVVYRTVTGERRNRRYKTWWAAIQQAWLAVDMYYIDELLKLK